MTEDAALDAAMAVMEAAFEPRWGEAWTRAQLHDSLAMPSTFLLLADRHANPVGDGAAAGFVLSRQALDEEELLLLAVRPEERARGLGTALVELYFAAARRRGVHRIFLEMRANNPAHSLYRRCGFEPIGIRPRYYRAADGQAIDAITFARQLSEPA
ncbi:MAG TPA: GNAT family N-acetyltransferase [Qipengyuania sp.]|nr:GNAT family N-acetyltransferase [Qipengyuania sp.]